MVGVFKRPSLPSGAPANVLTSEMVRDVFGLEADIVTDPRSGAPMFLPYGLTSSAHANRDGDIPVPVTAMPQLASVSVR